MRWLTSLQGWLRKPPPSIPLPLWNSTLAQLPFLNYLGESDRQRLKQLTEELLIKKPFSGSAGFELSDAMAVLIATQAALLVLNLRLDLYDDLSAVIVTADAFPISQQLVDDSGVVHEWEETLAGEAVDMGGAVLLSWPDIAPEGPMQPAHGAPAHNIVIHEFAHKIDMGRGGANGYPPFLAGFHARGAFSDWPQIFGAAYEDFCRRVDEMESALAADFDQGNTDDAAYAEQAELLAAHLPLDPYACRDPAEFFAVTSEAFFVSPWAIASAYPQVYQLLANYYRQDPLAASGSDSGPDSRTD